MRQQHPTAGFGLCCLFQIGYDGSCRSEYCTSIGYNILTSIRNPLAAIQHALSLSLPRCTLKSSQAVVVIDQTTSLKICCISTTNNWGGRQSYQRMKLQGEMKVLNHWSNCSPRKCWTWVKSRAAHTGNNYPSNAKRAALTVSSSSSHYYVR